MKYIGLMLICVLFGSCLNDGDCLITATNNMHVQFKTHRDNKTDTSITITSIFISGTDSALVPGTALTQILLPVDIHRDTTTYIFKYANAPSDTLQVSYSGQTKIIAKDCGAFTYYQNLRVLHTNFKLKEYSTSLLKDPTLGNTYSAYAVNYQIFY
jgi:hypothetical protein